MINLQITRSRERQRVAFGTERTFRLADPLDGREQLRRLIDTQQFMMSPDGSNIAYVVASGDGSCRVRCDQTLTPTRCKEIRLLNATPHRVRFWGDPIDGPAAVMNFGELFGEKIRAPLGKLAGVRRTRYGWLPHGRNEDDDVLAERYVLARASVVISSAMQVTVMHDGSLIGFDQATGCCIRWFLRGPEVVQECVRLPTDIRGAQQIRPLRWLDQTVVLVERAGDCAFVFGRKEWPVPGQVEVVWNSPYENAIALLVRCKAVDSRRGPYRRLLITNDLRQSSRQVREVYAGRFEMDRKALDWSPDGSQVIARVTDVDETYDDEIVRTEHLVTMNDNMAVPSGFTVREAAVDNQGQIAGAIFDDGTQCTPVCYGAVGESNPHLWGMRVLRNEVIYNGMTDPVTCRRYTVRTR